MVLSFLHASSEAMLQSHNEVRQVRNTTVILNYSINRVYGQAFRNTLKATLLRQDMDQESTSISTTKHRDIASWGKHAQKHPY